jgi:hypothetical protein
VEYADVKIADVPGAQQPSPGLEIGIHATLSARASNRKPCAVGASLEGDPFGSERELPFRLSFQSLQKRSFSGLARDGRGLPQQLQFPGLLAPPRERADLRRFDELPGFAAVGKPLGGRYPDARHRDATNRLRVDASALVDHARQQPFRLLLEEQWEPGRIIGKERESRMTYEEGQSPPEADKEAGPEGAPGVVLDVLWIRRDPRITLPSLELLSQG